MTPPKNTTPFEKILFGHLVRITNVMPHNIVGCIASDGLKKFTLKKLRQNERDKVRKATEKAEVKYNLKRKKRRRR